MTATFIGGEIVDGTSYPPAIKPGDIVTDVTKNISGFDNYEYTGRIYGAPQAWYFRKEWFKFQITIIPTFV